MILTGLATVYSHANAPLGTQVTVSTGTLSGLRSTDGLKQFFHIPYAKAPLDELRWLPPRPAEPWTGVRDASKAGPACMQVPAQEGEFFRPPEYADGRGLSAPERLEPG